MTYIMQFYKVLLEEKINPIYPPCIPSSDKYLHIIKFKYDISCTHII